MFAGILQLAKAVELKSELPSDLTKTLEALFQYRNYMFHNGLEWQTTRCHEFMALIERNQWHSWFSWAETRRCAMDLLHDRRVHQPFPRSCSPCARGFRRILQNQEHH